MQRAEGEDMRNRLFAAAAAISPAMLVALLQFGLFAVAGPCPPGDGC